tara:strand:- start:187 stop:693 length:507 start_codon:yes stop_codon:yes gene_type:complete
MSFYHIIDDALTEEQIKSIKNFQCSCGTLNLYEFDCLFKLEDIECVHPILQIASQYFDLSAAKYYEIWEQDNDRPKGWHYDKDEYLADSGDLRFPICSTIYYLEIGDDLVGGKLLMRDPDTFEKHYIEPKTNRLVVFGPGVSHFVDEFEGRRHSFLCNPWDKLLGQVN